MRIAYIHASKFGNGARVAEEFRTQAAAVGASVVVSHMRDLEPQSIPPADLYVLSSPGRMGRPPRSVRRFLQGLALPEGTRYAILTTEMAPRPDQRTGRMPTEAELAQHQRVRPIMNEILQGAGLVKVAEAAVHVTGIKGPLEPGWELGVKQFLADLV